MRTYNSYEKYLHLFIEATRLCFVYGRIRATPAKEVKKMKLRQIKKELEILKLEMLKTEKEAK